MFEQLEKRSQSERLRLDIASFSQPKWRLASNKRSTKPLVRAALPDLFLPISHVTHLPPPAHCRHVRVSKPSSERTWVGANYFLSPQQL